MDISIIEARKNIMISHALAIDSQFTTTINIDFEPDVMIINSVSYSSTVGDTFKIYSNIVSDCIASVALSATGGAGPLNVNINPNITFQIQKPIRGDYTFTMLDETGEAVDTSGKLFINLEFVKYKRVSTSMPLY